MRTRRLALLLTALLTLGALQATPAVRTAAFAQIRSSVYRVVDDRASEKACAEPRVIPAGPRVAGRVLAVPVSEPRVNPWLDSSSRFQRPPPASAVSA